jgi:hypothetical protein
MTAHFFDIETILVNDGKIWIVDRTIPNKPIMRISQSDFNLIRSGVYKSQKNLVEFAGEDYWLPTDISNSLKIKCKVLNTNFSNLAFSLQEFLNKDVIDTIKYDLNIENLQHIKNTNDDIYIICSKNTKRNYEIIIKKIEEKLEKIGLKITKFFFISETFYDQNTDDISYNKIKLLLQHIIGFKSEGNMFTDEKIKKYENVNFYDEDPNTIKLALNSNNLLRLMIDQSEPLLKERILDILRNEDNFITVNEVSTNKVKRFNIKKIELEYSIIIKTFEGYKNSIRF